MEATSRAGDPRDAAFDRYVVPEVEVLLRVALALSRQPADAEDLVQDTLIRAYRAVGSFDGRHPRAWLLTILRNTHVNRNRRWRPELLYDLDAGRSRIEAVPDQHSRTPEECVVDEVFDAVVSDALASLSARFQQVVRLVDVEGLSYAETARALGVPEGTVMSRLHRARGRIRAKLAEAGITPRAGRR